jgi:hypothetical protein
VHGNGDDNVQVVAVSSKNRMRRNTHGDKEIAVFPAMRTRMALPDNANPSPILDPGRDRNDERFGPHIHLPTAAHRAPRIRLHTGASTSPTRLGKHHVSTCGLHDAGAFALDTAPFHGWQPPQTAARPAVLLPRNGDLVRPPAHGFVKGEPDCLMKIGATDRRVARFDAPMQDVGEQIAER